MSKIRKGSLVWDRLNRRQTKVLTSPSKGEVPDQVIKATGQRYSQKMKNGGVVLVESDEGYITHNNKHCYMIRLELLMPLKEYLEIEPHLTLKNN